jgi:hypothetical protein
VQRGEKKPSPAQDDKAQELNSTVTLADELADTGVTGAVWLLGDTELVMEAELEHAVRKKAAELEAELEHAERCAQRGAQPSTSSLLCERANVQLDTTGSKVLNVSFPDGGGTERWYVHDQKSLEFYMIGSLAPAARPHVRINQFELVTDGGDYTFVPPEAVLNAPVVHNVTFRFDLMDGGSQEPLPFSRLSPSHLDEVLRLHEAAGLTETIEGRLMGRRVIRDFAELRVTPRTG